MESKVVVPAEGKKITLQNGKINVPHNPIIPFIEGDGIGVDVTPVRNRRKFMARTSGCQPKRWT